MKKTYLIFTFTIFNYFSALMAQKITSFSPIYAKPGDIVTIKGTGFNATTANNVVFFGATRATVTAASTTSITATVPIGATYAPITLLNTGTSLTTFSASKFIPAFSPAKTSLSTKDFLPKEDITATGSRPISVAIGDLDGDGKPDLVVANYSAAVLVFRNTSSKGTLGSSSFASSIDYTSLMIATSLALGDLDSDGKLDLVVTNALMNKVLVFRNTSSIGDISFEPYVEFETGNNPYSVAIDDLDGDGKADIAVANKTANTVSVLHNTSNVGNIATNSFEYKVDFKAGQGAISLATSDIDGDGKSDLVVANSIGNTVSVLRNTTINGSINTSSFAAPIDFITGANPYSVAIGDLDGDGKPDLTVANNLSNSVSVLRNTSIVGSITTSSFANKVDFVTGVNPRSISIGDLNGDGKLDLAVANSSSNSVSVLRNISNSGISFATKVDFATGISSRTVGIGDLDGDSKPDLAVANYSSSTISLLRNADFVLPTVLDNFTVEELNGKIILRFQTHSEINSDYISVEHSTDAFTFSSIDKLNAIGSNIAISNYTFTHSNPLAGTNYYRLKQVDKDGSFQYSEVKTINLNVNRTIIAKVYPNPTRNILNVQLDKLTGNASAELTDLLGKSVIKRSLNKGNNLIDITYLQKGTYIISVITNEEKFSRTVVIE